MTDEQYRQLCEMLKHLSVPLKEHLETRLTAMDKAVDEARRQMELKMDGFPEQFVRKGEIDANMAEMKTQLCDLNEFKAKAEGMASQRSLEVVRWVAIVGILLSILGIMLRHYGV